jgi:hypothetical protein
MKNTLKKTLTVTLLFAATTYVLPAQTNPPAPATSSVQGTGEVEQAKIKAETELAKNKLEAERSETLNAQDAAKAEVLNRQDAKKMMVHDLAWNSWVLAVLGGILMSGLFRHQRNKMVNQTVRLMIEKGAPVTPELVTALKSRGRSGSRKDPAGYLAWGLILIAVGIGVLIAFGKAGWIVALIGIAYLILWIADGGNASEEKSK